MAHLPMWGPDPAKPGPSEPGASSASGGLWVSPEELSATDAPPGTESDLAELAERFSAHSGGGLSKESSANLALEIVLNEIVEQACLATGATGAAIVLERGGELVCRASTGANAPALGVRLGTDAGLTGACVKTLQIQRCDDAQSDSRADMEASRWLGIRSVMVLPLLRNHDLLGLFEVFSSYPSAFGERDERTLEALAQRTLNNLQRAAETLVTRVKVVTEAPAPAAPAEERLPAEPETRPRDDSADVYAAEEDRQDRIPQADGVTLALGAVVFACAILLSTLVGLHFGRQRGTDNTHRAKPANGPASRTQQQNGNSSNAGGSPFSAGAAGTSASTDPLPAVGSPAMSGQRVGASAAQPDSRQSDSRPAGARPALPAPPAGSLMIYENGKEVFRMLPSGPGGEQDAKRGEVDGASAPAPAFALSPDDAASSLLHRVEPEYPKQARQQGIQGPVVLDLRIGKDGVVEDVGFVSGQTVLADAATSAVKHWRFKPHYVDGREVEMQTRITLRFTLPTLQVPN